MVPKGVKYPPNRVKSGHFRVFGTPHFGSGSNHILAIVDLVPKGVQNLVPLLELKMDHPEDLILDHFWTDPGSLHWRHLEMVVWRSPPEVQNMTPKWVKKRSTVLTTTGGTL